MEENIGDHWPLVTLMIELTYACIYRCRHCYLGDQNPLFLRSEIVYKVLNEAKALGTETLVLTGGEPTLHPEWKQIVLYARDLGFRIQLETVNVNLVNDHEALNILKRIDQVHVSIDVPPGRRGLLRPYDYNIKIVNFIRTLKENGCNVFLFATLYRSNLDYLIELVELANKLDVPILFNFLLREGRATTIPEKEFFTKDELKDLMTKLYYLYKQGLIPRQRIIYQCLVDPDIQRVSREFKDSNVIGGCIAGILTAVVSATGDVYPCPHLRISLGNVYERSLTEIWNEHPLLDKLRDRDNLKGRCKSCELRNVCGGCRASAYNVYGDPLAEDPHCFRELP